MLRMYMVIMATHDFFSLYKETELLHLTLSHISFTKSPLIIKQMVLLLHHI